MHRVGRTARAETTGTAVTLVNERDQRKFYSIERLIGEPITKMPLPTHVGEGPAYSPADKPKDSFRRKNSRSPRKFKRT